MLDRLYPNRFSNLKPGRIRYGVLGSDAGRIVDDGTICRLDDETFYVTTTSSGAGAMEEWFGWWLADWRMDVRLTDVTQGLAAVNLAGPKAREIMGALTELDCSNEGFAYLDGKRARVAGVESLILRIGFVGEVGYEIHFPAAYGQDVWDAILGDLSDLDVSSAGFTYLDGKRGKVAGVDALLLRIGFVGEVGYEIHFAAAYGLSLIHI